MKEVTNIATVQITTISKGVSEEKLKEYFSKLEEIKKELTATIKENLGVDDVILVDYKDFVRDTEE